MDKKQLEKLHERVKQKNENAHLHVPYSQKFAANPDFEVSYKLDIDEQLSSIKITQGIRCDFIYLGDDPLEDGVHMIWPEFLDVNGNVVLDRSVLVGSEGNAYMWVLDRNEKSIEFHRNRLDVGTKGYWLVGSKKIAEVEVVKLIDI